MKAYFLNNKWKCHRSTIQSTKKKKKKKAYYVLNFKKTDGCHSH